MQSISKQKHSTAEQIDWLINGCKSPFVLNRCDLTVPYSEPVLVYNLACELSRSL